MDPKSWPIHKLQSILYRANKSVTDIARHRFIEAALSACCIESMAIRWKLPVILRLARAAYKHCLDRRAFQATETFKTITEITNQRIDQTKCVGTAISL